MTPSANSALQLADLLSSNGVPAQLHAENWNSSQDAGHPGDGLFCRASMSQQDIVFFHLSTEDPALLSIAGLPCRKLLYFTASRQRPSSRPMIRRQRRVAAPVSRNPLGRAASTC